MSIHNVAGNVYINSLIFAVILGEGFVSKLIFICERTQPYWDYSIQGLTGWSWWFWNNSSAQEPWDRTVPGRPPFLILTSSLDPVSTLSFSKWVVYYLFSHDDAGLFFGLLFLYIQISVSSDYYFFTIFPLAKVWENSPGSDNLYPPWI